MMIVLDGRGVQLSLSFLVLANAGFPASLGGFHRGAAGGGQDLQGPLGDGGLLGGALLFTTDMVHMVSKKATVSLQGHTRN